MDKLKIRIMVMVGDTKLYSGDAESFEIAFQQLSRMENLTEEKNHCPDCGYCDRSSCQNCIWCETEKESEDETDPTNF